MLISSGIAYFMGLFSEFLPILAIQNGKCMVKLGAQFNTLLRPLVLVCVVSASSLYFSSRMGSY